MVNGNNIFISIDANAAPFAATRANEIQTECETIEISSPSVGDWRQFIKGRKEWSFTVSWLFGDTQKIKLLETMIGEEVNITVYGREGNTTTKLLQGSAICKQATVTLTRGNLANGSFSFKGNGPLVNFVPVANISISAPSLSMTVGQTKSNPVTVTVYPSDATEKHVAWSSSDTSKAVVTQSGDNFTIQAIEAGTCNLVATATDGSGTSNYCVIEIGSA